MELSALMVEVEAAFTRTSAGLLRWDDPHPPPDRIVADEEYERVTNPGKWRIVGARADAWIDALVDLGLATVEHGADLRWVESPTSAFTRADLVRPTAEGAVPLVVCRGRIEDVPDAGVTLGVGDPAVRIAFIPDCGCDACDSGSQNEIDHLDKYIRPVVTGEFRHLRRGRQSITVLEDGRMQGSNIRPAESNARPDGIGGGWFRYQPTSRPVEPFVASTPRPRKRSRDRMAEILADPSGWDEVSGASWLTGPHGDMRH